jgi:RimJ/RimL family protein N-acetyltransferase
MTGTGSPSATSATTTYELRVDGHLDDHWAATLGGLELTRLDDGTTSLTGPIVDQAGLHGVLARVRDLGVPLLGVHTLDGTEATPTLQPDPVHPATVRPALTGQLSTERLVLRPAIPADADATWTYRRLPDVGEWLTDPSTDLDAYRTTFTDPDRLAATVIVEHGRTLIGDFMLRIEDAWAQADVADQARRRQAELGWVLDPTHTGHGYATESVHALLAYCFTVVGVRRVVASCFLANGSSWRLMERVGMRREGHAIAESLHRSGRWLDTVSYALLATEWTASQPHGRRLGQGASRARVSTGPSPDRRSESESAGGRSSRA